MNADYPLETVRNILFEYDTRRLEAARAANFHPAHYTTAENAINILRGGQLWARNAVVMNDFSEIEHGWRCLQSVLCGDVGTRLAEILDDTHVGLMAETDGWLRMSEKLTRAHTYMTSWSEHDPDDRVGRLSMWRAYGGSTAGVALVIDREASIMGRAGFASIYSPVFYGSALSLAEHFSQQVEALSANRDALRASPRQGVGELLRRALHFTVLSVKHPGFEEEREWRSIMSPAFLDARHFLTGVETVRGVPQQIVKLSLFDGETAFHRGASLDEMIRGVIIGPCEFPDVIKHAFIRLLGELGSKDAANKVHVSGIPLRQKG